MREDNVIFGLFAREGYEQHDTSRHCCDGRCFQRNPSQGGSCPLVPHQRPAPRMPRVVCRPERRTSPVFRFIFIAIVCVLCAAAIVNVASQVSL